MEIGKWGARRRQLRLEIREKSGRKTVRGLRIPTQGAISVVLGHELRVGIFHEDEVTTYIHAPCEMWASFWYTRSCV